MKKNVIYAGFFNEYRYVVDYLFKEHDWNPVFIYDSEHMRAWAKENYPDAVFCEAMQLRNAQFDYALIGKTSAPLDAKIISVLSKYESRALGLAEDTTGYNFSFNERKRYYYDLLKFCNTVIRYLKPDIYVIWTFPDVTIDYVLYQLCRYYNVRILFINPTALFDHAGEKYYHVNISVEDQSKVFAHIYNSDKTYKLSDKLKKYFDSVRSERGMIPPYIAYFWKSKHWNPVFWDKWFKEGRHLLKLFLTGRFFEKMMYVAWKSNRFPFDSERSKMNYLQWILFQERVRRDDKKLRRIYSSVVTKPDLDKKYIYYAAAFQPEASIWSTYEDQLLILDLLSASIPRDWVIYYKEHPTTFMPGGKASLIRNRNYYERIAAYKNVRTIPFEEDSYMLIDAAQAVATPSGTTGWEAVVRGKPALIFGHVWYEGCRSVFKIETHQDCVDAIEKIKNGYKPDQSDIERFAAAVEQVSEKNILHGDFVYDQIKACPDTKYEMGRIAKLLHEAHERYYVKGLS